MNMHQCCLDRSRLITWPKEILVLMMIMFDDIAIVLLFSILDGHHTKLMVFTRKNPVAWKLQSHRGQRQTEHKQIDELSNKFVKTDQNFPCTFETSLIAVFCTRMV